MDAWDFYPKWIIEFSNGDMVYEQPFSWRHIPKMCAQKDAFVKYLYIDWGFGLVEEIPYSRYYYFAYRLAQGLSGGLRAHSKVFGYGDDPSAIEAVVCDATGSCGKELIISAKPPFLIIS